MVFVLHDRRGRMVGLLRDLCWLGGRIHAAVQHRRRSKALQWQSQHHQAEEQVAEARHIKMGFYERFKFRVNRIAISRYLDVTLVVKLLPPDLFGW